MRETIQDFTVDKKFIRDGIEIQKDVVFSDAQLVKNEALFRKYCHYFRAYPDKFVDLITPTDSNIKLTFYQRMFFRACMRYKYVYVVAPRGAAKTYTTIFALILKCIFEPNSKVFICAPGIEQGAKIAKEKIQNIFAWYPMLKNEMLTEGNFGRNYVNLFFKNNSTFDIVAARDSQRGGRRTAGLIDETRDQDASDITTIVLPLLTEQRRMANGSINPNEPHSSQFYMTSASSKANFAYEKIIELFTTSIVHPKTAFVMGFDYRLPVAAGLISQDFIDDQKYSPTMSEEDFAREYMGVFTGGSEDSWYNFDKILKYRTLKRAEFKQKAGLDNDYFYFISVDIGRFNDQTVAIIYKVKRTPRGFYSSIVNIYILGQTPQDKIFSNQARDLKELIELYHPVDVIIDGNGNGVGLVDAMILPSVSHKGNPLPAYGSYNDEHYLEAQSRECIQLLYIIKGNSALNSQIFDNAYTQINSGKTRFLVDEQQAKEYLLSTQKGMKMSLEDRINWLTPYRLTSELFDQIMNVKLKTGGSLGNTSIEAINKNRHDDKFMSLCYGLWRLKMLEEDYLKNLHTTTDNRKLIFVTKKKRPFSR